ncbi:MAG: hypothetical protein N838_23915 [Thiohalocapsa sp. PB-PSB1]|nr:MAG: hypothetical protein N838_23915 [Thiohalocapsa sp. PB-PSB1]
MGLRLNEGLQLQIDATRERVHMRGGKGDKDRSVTLPEKTLAGGSCIGSGAPIVIRSCCSRTQATEHNACKRRPPL